MTGAGASPHPDEVKPDPLDPVVDEPSGGASNWLPLAAVVALGLAVRLLWLYHQRHMAPGGDAYYYHHQADLLARGKWFVDPLNFLAGGRSQPDADHPPLFVSYLALWSLAGARSVLWHLLAGTLLGTATVAVIAVTGKWLGGLRVGVIAGFVAAVAPNLWVWDAMLAAETMAAFAVALYLMSTVRYLRRPSRAALCVVAAAAALAALARSELILLLFATIPLALRTDGIDSRRRRSWLGAAAVTVLVLIGPWAMFNQARFGRPVPLSTGLGLVLASSNCDSTWYGPSTGYWDFGCSTAAVTAVRGDDTVSAAQRGVPPVDGAELDGRLRSLSARYAAAHASRLPAVVGARLGRVSGLYRPLQQAHLQADYEGVEEPVAGAILGTWYLIAGLAVVGGLALRRAGVPLLALGAPLIVVVVTTVVSYGIARFRVPAETSVILFAAVGVDSLVRRHLEGGAAAAPDGLIARISQD